MDESLLARHPLRHFARPNDFADPVRLIDTFEIRFDFIDHELRIVKSDGAGDVLNCVRNRWRNFTGQ